MLLIMTYLCDENNISYLELSVAYDGLAVIINPENDWVDYFTVGELSKIWHPDAQNNIKYWSQIREGWPNEEIHLFGPGTASGTYDYFAEVICGKKVGTRGDYTASEDDHVLVQGVATDKYGLGFFGLAYYEENKDKLKLVGVDNGNGSVLPSMETVSNGTYAPLSRPIFIYANNSAREREEVKEFISFYLKNAGNLVADVGYIPLTKDEYNLEKEGYNVVTADNGKKALEIAKKILPDLIILDVMMPEMDGVSTCIEIKKHPKLSDVLILLVRNIRIILE